MKITISKISLAERVVALVERAQQKVVFAANLARVYADVMPSKLDLKRIVLEENQYAKECLLALAEAKKGWSP